MGSYSNIISYNLIRLAAVSNYKLAQLTFEAPSRSTLQRTMHVKKMLDELYQRTPPDWFSQMVRWEFLTVESLEAMTPEETQVIIDRYKEIIRHFPGDNYTLNMENMKYTESSNNVSSWSSSTLLSTLPPPRKAPFSQRLATELVNLFDMEFTLDLSAPYENLLDAIDESYPMEEKMEDWSYMEPNCQHAYDPSVDSSFDSSESDEDDMSNSLTSPVSTLASSIYSVDYTDLFDSIPKKKTKPFEKLKSSLSKTKSQPKEKGLRRSPSVASKILKRLSPF
jgi:hypothetical protein